MAFKPVKIPSKDIVFSRRKNCTYVYYTTKKIFNKEKGYSENERACIGIVSDEKETMMIPNENYVTYFGDFGISLEENDSQFSRVLSFGARLVVDKILEKLNVSSILNKVFKEKTDLIKSLICYFIDDQNSTAQHYEKWARRNAIFGNKIDSQSTISRLYNNVLNEDSVMEFTYMWNVEFQKNSFSRDIILSLDSTNFNTYSENINLAEYGKAKVDEGLKQINLAYVIDNETTMPLFYQTFLGSVTDQTQYKELINKSIEYGYKNPTLVMDRGFFNTENVNYLENADYKYIIMAKSRNKSLDALLEENRNKIRDNFNCYIEKFGCYGLKLKTKVIGEKEQFVYIYYNGELAENKKKAFFRKMQKAKQTILDSKLDIEVLKKEYKNFFDINVDENNQKVVFLKENVFEKVHKNAGFSIIVSNVDSDLEFILTQYKKRDLVEKAFSTVKTTFDLNKFNVQDRLVLESKMFISFLALIVRSYFSYCMKEFLAENGHHTVNTLFSELSKMELAKFNKTYVSSYGLSKTQKIILSALKITEKDRSEEHTSELQSRLDLVCRLLLEKKKKGKEL